MCRDVHPSVYAFELELTNYFFFPIRPFFVFKIRWSVPSNVIVVYKYTGTPCRACTALDEALPRAVVPCCTSDHYLGSVSPEVKVLRARRTYAHDFLRIPRVRVRTLVCYCNVRICRIFFIYGLNPSATVFAFYTCEIRAYETKTRTCFIRRSRAIDNDHIDSGEATSETKRHCLAIFS